jgi:hypothetical protein
MRKMIKGNLKLDVVEHIILRNMWEYYVLSDEGQNDWVSSEPDIVMALVMGFNDEIGCVSLSEIKPHIMTRTTDLSEIMPADGYEWENDSVEVRHIIGQNTASDDWTKWG